MLVAGRVILLQTLFSYDVAFVKDTGITVVRRIPKHSTSLFTHSQYRAACAVPALTVGDLLRRMQRTNSRESTQTIWDWECSGCQRGTSAAEPIELDDEEVEELPPTSSSGQKLSIDLTDDADEVLEASLSVPLFEFDNAPFSRSLWHRRKRTHEPQTESHQPDPR